LDWEEPGGSAAEGGSLGADTVLVHREGYGVIITPANDWPLGYVQSFAGISDDYTRLPQGEIEKGASLR